MVDRVEAPEQRDPVLQVVVHPGEEVTQHEADHHDCGEGKMFLEVDAGTGERVLEELTERAPNQNAPKMIMGP